MTVEVGRFIQFPGDDNQFAVLVDNRDGQAQGRDPAASAVRQAAGRAGEAARPIQELPRAAPTTCPTRRGAQEHYSDPLAVDPEGGEYNRRWLAQMEPVRVRGHDTGWIVIVQEAYDTAIGATLDELTRGLIRSGLIALGLIALVMAGLWGMAKRLSMKQDRDECECRRINVE